MTGRRPAAAPAHRRGVRAGAQPAGVARLLRGAGRRGRLLRHGRRGGHRAGLAARARAAHVPLREGAAAAGALGLPGTLGAAVAAHALPDCGACMLPGMPCRVPRPLYAEDARPRMLHARSPEHASRHSLCRKPPAPMHHKGSACVVLTPGSGVSALDSAAQPAVGAPVCGLAGNTAVVTRACGAGRAVRAPAAPPDAMQLAALARPQPPVQGLQELGRLQLDLPQAAWALGTCTQAAWDVTCPVAPRPACSSA
jgi:hypothetical protein